MLDDFSLAERVGFEPTAPFLVRRFSRPFHSTALAPLPTKKKLIAPIFMCPR